MRGIIGKALKGAGEGLAQVSLIELQSQALEAREKRLAEFKAGIENRNSLVEVGDPNSPTGTRYSTREDAAGQPGPGNTRTSGSRKTYGNIGIIPGTNLIGQQDSDGQWHALPGQDKNSSADDKKTLQAVVAPILEKMSRGEKLEPWERDTMAVYNDLQQDPTARVMGAAFGGRDLETADIGKRLDPYTKRPGSQNADGTGSAAAPAAGSAGGGNQEGAVAIDKSGKGRPTLIYHQGKWVPAQRNEKTGQWEPASNAK